MTQSQKWYWLGITLIFVGLFYVLKPILTPFMIAALLAYLGDPIVNYLEKWKISRTWGVVLVFALLILVLFLILFFLIPILQKQIALLIVKIPQMINWVEQVLIPWINTKFDLHISLDVATAKTELGKHWQKAGDVVAIILKYVTHSGFALLEFCTMLILIPLVAFYLLRDWNKALNSITSLLPRRIEPTLVKLAGQCDLVVGAFLRGQLWVMLVLAFIYAIGLSIVGLDMALLVGLIAGLMSIVPYLGFIVGIVAAGIAAAFQFHDVKHFIMIAIVFAVGHLCEGFILTPLLVGDRIGLHPVAVIFAILAGGQLFGFVGILIALPVAAVILVFLRHLRSHYINSDMYHS